MKYMNNTNGRDCNPYYFIRLAEAYLIKAEAEVRQSKYSDARNSLKVITDRAGYDVDYVNSIADSDLLMQIFRHKFIELSAENYEEWFDMVGWNRFRLTWVSAFLCSQKPTYPLRCNGR